MANSRTFGIESGYAAPTGAPRTDGASRGRRQSQLSLHRQLLNPNTSMEQVLRDAVARLEAAERTLFFSSPRRATIAPPRLVAIR